MPGIPGTVENTGQSGQLAQGSAAPDFQKPWKDAHELFEETCRDKAGQNVGML